MLTLNQVMTAIREQMFVELPDGRTGIIAAVQDYDALRYEVTVTLENGERVSVHQFGEIKPALAGAFPNPFAAQLREWQEAVTKRLNPPAADDDGEPQP